MIQRERDGLRSPSGRRRSSLPISTDTPPRFGIDSVDGSVRGWADDRGLRVSRSDGGREAIVVDEPDECRPEPEWLQVIFVADPVGCEAGTAVEAFSPDTLGGVLIEPSAVGVRVTLSGDADGRGEVLEAGSLTPEILDAVLDDFRDRVR